MAKKYLRDGAHDAADGTGIKFLAPFTIDQETEIISGTKAIGHTTAGIGFFLTDPNKALVQIRGLAETTAAQELRLKYFDVATQDWVQVGDTFAVPDTSGVGKDNIAATFVDAAMPLTPVTWMVEGTKSGGGTYKLTGVSGAVFQLP